jgi:hypothetical protein
MDAECKVLAFALIGMLDGERTEAVDRLHRALGASLGEHLAHVEPKDMLKKYVKRGLQQIANEGDAPSNVGANGKENAKP